MLETDKSYIVVCHGCGRFHEFTARYVCSPLMLGVTDDDGSTVAVPAIGCPDCMAVKAVREQDHPIRRAFDHGPTSATLARMEREFLLDGWRERLREARV